MATRDDNVSSTLDTSNIDINAFLRSLDDIASENMVPVYVYLALVMTSGLLGNLLVCVVYLTKFKVSTTRHFIVTMAVLDLLNCMLAIPVEFVDLYRSYTYPDVLCKVHAIVTAFSSIGSALVLVVVARDRYWKICRPLALQMQPRQARNACLGCAAAAILAAWPCALLYGLEHVDTSLSHVTGRRCSSDEQFVHTVFPLLYGCVLLLLFIGSIVALATLYSLLCRRLHIQQCKHDRVHSPCSSNAVPSASACDGEIASDEVMTEGQSANESSEYSASADSVSNAACEAEPVVEYTRYLSEDMDDSDNARIWSVENYLSSGAEGMDDGITTTKELFTCTHFEGKDNVAFLQRENDGARDKLVSHPSSTIETTEARTLESVSTTSRDRESAAKNDSIDLDKAENAAVKEGEEPSEKPSTMPGPRVRVTKGRSQRRKRATRRTTITLFLVTLIYVLSYLPYLMISVVHALYEELFQDMGPSAAVVYALFVRLFYFQSAANPFIYGIRNPDFRAKSRQLLSCGR